MSLRSNASFRVCSPSGGLSADVPRTLFRKAHKQMCPLVTGILHFVAGVTTILCMFLNPMLQLPGIGGDIHGMKCMEVDSKEAFIANVICGFCAGTYFICGYHTLQIIRKERATKHLMTSLATSCVAMVVSHFMLAWGIMRLATCGLSSTVWEFFRLLMFCLAAMYEISVGWLATTHCYRIVKVTNRMTELREERDESAKLVTTEVMTAL